MVYFHSSISVCNSVDQSTKLMANSVGNHHVNKYRRVANCLNNCSSSSTSNPICDRSRSSAAVDVAIFIAVVFACGFLLYPYVEFLAVNLIDFVTAVHCVLQDEIGRNPMIYGSIGITTFCAAIGGWIVLLCTARKCMNPNCKGLRKAAEFDIQLETEECVKAASNNGGVKDGGVSKRGLFELPRDHHRELEAELKKMAPPNGRAVLVFRARCGCSVGRLEVPGAKKVKRIKEKFKTDNPLLPNLNTHHFPKTKAEENTPHHDTHHFIIFIVVSLPTITELKPELSIPSSSLLSNPTMAGAKLVVEVIDAVDLMPKDGQGSASPYVEVEFNGTKLRTSTKSKDLNPQWNEKLVFNLSNDDARDLPNSTIQVVVYNHGNDVVPPKNFLGRVRISGSSVVFSDEGESVGAQPYPLDKRGLFSHIKGEILLKVYASVGNRRRPAAMATAAEVEIDPGSNSDSVEEDEFRRKRDNHEQGEMKEDKKHKEKDKVRTFDSIGGGGGGFRETNQNSNSAEEEEFHHNRHNHEHGEMKEKKKHKEKDKVRIFHSIGHNQSHHHQQLQPPPRYGGGGGFETQYHVMRDTTPVVETRTSYARAATPVASSVMHHMHMPKQNPEFLLVETSPPLAARMRYNKGGDKTSSTYDLVEKMHFLYVSVVKCRDLPVMDVTGSLDPYVEVKLGNYKGMTKHHEKNQNPTWHQIFAFSKERLQSNLLEVVVKDKDFAKDDFVGRVNFDLTEVPVRVPPDSPLAPQWYRLEDKKGYKGRGGEIMLAVWMGTQADEAFPEAWHSDAHDIGHINLANTRSKVYFSPKLYYLRVKVFEAQDLVPYDRSRVPDTYVKVVLGSQGRNTRPSQMRTVNPIWGEELMYVASEPFEEFIIVSVEDRVGPGRDETLGRVVVSFRDVPQRLETSKMPEPRWFNLMRPSYGDEDGKERHKEKFSSKILLGLTLEAGYHVLDESTHFSSNLQPSSKHLRKSNIGILELGILSARNLLPMKGRDGRTTDSYCVAKYGNKWVRTRTLLNTLHPKWNEQFSWEVFDPCTVITIGVFDNWHTNGHTDAQDKRIGKVRIRLSTLETDRIYTHYYPLLVLQPNGLKKHGEIQLALRFTCTAWVNMVAQYSRPLLPKMHYAHPIPVRYIDWLRHQAMQIVATRLARAEPPLRREVVEYMLDVDYHMWSLRRSKANFHRIMSVLSTVTGVFKWFNEICYWRNPITTCLVHILFLILVCYPELVLPTVFLYLFVIGLWNYRFRPRHPPHMDIRLSQAEHVHPDELDEEFDSFPTSRPADIVRMRYDRLRSVAGRVQTVIGDLASQGERAHAILSWRDPRATAIFIVFALVSAVFIYVTPFQVVAVLVGVFMLRHPRFRSRMPSVPVNFFKRLPAKSDLLL